MEESIYGECFDGFGKLFDIDLCNLDYRESSGSTLILKLIMKR